MNDQYKENPGTEQPSAKTTVHLTPYLSRIEGAYEVDLTKLKGEGDFPCPECDALISPKDETDDVYSILETKVRNEALEEVVIRCNKCRTIIRLVGLLISESEKYSETKDEK